MFRFRRWFLCCAAVTCLARSASAQGRAVKRLPHNAVIRVTGHDGRAANRQDRRACRAASVYSVGRVRYIFAHWTEIHPTQFDLGPYVELGCGTIGTVTVDGRKFLWSAGVEDYLRTDWPGDGENHVYVRKVLSSEDD